MRIDADRERCVGSGMCVLTLPEVFDQDNDDGRVILRNPTPGPELHDRVREAVMLCPARALSLPEEAPSTSLRVAEASPESSAGRINGV